MRPRSAILINRAYPPFPGETGRLVRDLALALTRRGWATTVVCAGGQDGDGPDGPVRLVRRRAIGQRTGDLAAPLRSIAGVLRSLPVADVAVTLTDPPLLPLLGTVLRGRCGAWVHWCQDMYPDLLPFIGIPLPPGRMTALSRRTIDAVDGHDAVVAIGTCMARALVSRGVAADRTTVVPNWPRLSADRPWARPPEPGPLRLAYSGGLSGAHGIATVAAVLTRLQARAPAADVAAYLSPRDRDRLRQALASAPARYWPAIRRLADGAGLRRHLAGIDLHIAAIAPGAGGLLLPSKIGQAIAGGRRCLYVGPADSDAATAVVAAGGDARLAVDPQSAGGIDVAGLVELAALPPPAPIDPARTSVETLADLVIGSADGIRPGHAGPIGTTQASAHG